MVPAFGASGLGVWVPADGPGLRTSTPLSLREVSACFFEEWSY